VPEVKSAVETLSPTRVKLTVEVAFEELKPMLDEAYRTIGASVQIPGFRKGKVPSRIIDQRVGQGAVVQEAVNEALPRFFAEAAEAENVRVIGKPEVDVTAVPLEEGQHRCLVPLERIHRIGPDVGQHHQDHATRTAHRSTVAGRTDQHRARPGATEALRRPQGVQNPRSRLLVAGWL